MLKYWTCYVLQVGRFLKTLIKKNNYTQPFFKGYPMSDPDPQWCNCSDGTLPCTKCCDGSRDRQTSLQRAPGGTLPGHSARSVWHGSSPIRNDRAWPLRMFCTSTASHSRRDPLRSTADPPTTFCSGFLRRLGTPLVEQQNQWIPLDFHIMLTKLTWQPANRMSE